MIGDTCLPQLQITFTVQQNVGDDVLICLCAGKHRRAVSAHEAHAGLQQAQTRARVRVHLCTGQLGHLRGWQEHAGLTARACTTQRGWPFRLIQPLLLDLRGRMIRPRGRVLPCTGTGLLRLLPRPPSRHLRQDDGQGSLAGT